MPTTTRRSTTTSTPTTPPARVCSTASGTRLAGGPDTGLSPYPIANVATAPVCFSNCSANPLCKQFIYFAPGKVCYLYSTQHSSTQPTFGSDFTSGYCGLSHSCTLHSGYRYAGGVGDNVYPYPVSNILTASKCQNFCNSVSSCKQYVYYGPGKVCYMMNVAYPLSSATQDSSFTSGICA